MLSFLVKFALAVLAAVLALFSVRLSHRLTPRVMPRLNRAARRALEASNRLASDVRGYVLPDGYRFGLEDFFAGELAISEHYEKDDHGQGRLTLHCQCGLESQHLHVKHSLVTLRDPATRRHQYQVVGYHPVEGCDVCRFEASGGKIPLSAWTKHRLHVERVPALVRRLAYVPAPMPPRRRSFLELALNIVGGLFPSGPTEGGGYAGLFRQSAHIVSPQNASNNSATPDQFIPPTTWAAAGTASLQTNFDGAEFRFLDPLQKLTAANTLTISSAGGQSIDNAASLVLNAAGAGAILSAVVVADGVGASTNQFAHVTAP